MLVGFFIWRELCALFQSVFMTVFYLYARRNLSTRNMLSFVHLIVLGLDHLYGILSLFKQRLKIV